MRCYGGGRGGCLAECIEKIGDRLDRGKRFVRQVAPKLSTSPVEKLDAAETIESQLLLKAAWESNCPRRWLRMVQLDVELGDQAEEC